MAKRRHHFNMYFTTTISISLVLFLVGLEVVMLIATRELFKHVKENVAVELIMTENPDSTELNRLYRILDVAPFCNEYNVITKEQALEEHIKYLGEDPTLFLDYNPLHASVVVYLTETYAHTDSIPAIENKLRNFSCIEKIDYPKNVVELLDKNLNYFSIILLGVAALLLFISIALINNTLRLSIYSKRFIIHTMKLVGATSWFIKRPIIGHGLLMGIVASILAATVLAGAVYYLQTELNIILFDITWQNICIIFGSMLLTGLVITYCASAFAANKYIRMNVNDLYYI